VQCNICGEAVDNSEDLAKHMEKMHAMGEDEPEKESAELPEEQEEAEPAQRLG